MPTLKVRFNKNRDPKFEVYEQGVLTPNLRATSAETITWQLAQNVTARGVRFEDPGIVFQPTTTTPATWPFAQPASSDGGVTWTVNDPVSANSKGTYAYTINVVTPNGTHYSTDPDVTNSPQGG